MFDLDDGWFRNRNRIVGLLQFHAKKDKNNETILGRIVPKSSFTQTAEMASSHHQHHRCSLHQCLILFIVMVIWGLMIMLVGHIALASSEQPTSTTTKEGTHEKHKNHDSQPVLFTFEQITELIQWREKKQRHGDHTHSNQFLSSDSSDENQRRNCRKCNEHDDDKHLSEYLQKYIRKQSLSSSSPLPSS